MEELLEAVTGALGDRVLETVVHAEQLTIRLSRDTLLEDLTTLRNDSTCRFAMLLDITAMGRLEQRIRAVMTCWGRGRELPPEREFNRFLTEFLGAFLNAL